MLRASLLVGDERKRGSWRQREGYGCPNSGRGERRGGERNWKRSAMMQLYIRRGGLRVGG
jgi:hypothetical protein